jgi:chromosome segregation ATPase
MSVANAPITSTPPALNPITVELQNLRNDIMALAQALVALQKRVADAEVNTTEVRPQLVALKVHSESLPQALRELRRGDAALQKKLDSLDSRLRAFEEKLAAAART